MAEELRYKDTDVPGGGAGDGTTWVDAYDTFLAWSTGEAKNLVTATDWHHLIYRASSGGDDTTNFNMTGWTANATYYVLIEPEAGQEALASGWQAGRHVFNAEFGMRTPYTYLYGMQVASPQYQQGCRIQFASAGGEIRIGNCRFSGIDNNTEPIECNDSSIDLKIFCCVLDQAGGTVDHGVQIINSNTAGIYNNTIYGWSDGIQIVGNGNTCTCKNNAVFGCNDDFNDADGSTLDYNASDDGDGTNSVAPSGADWDNEFTDSANGDFELVAAGNCQDGGTNDPGSGLYSTGINGVAFDNPWDIGAFAIAAVGGSVVSQIQVLRNMNIIGMILNKAGVI